MMGYNKRLDKLKRSGSNYLLYDTFKTVRAAGDINGTKAEPGPGTRRVTDTGDLLIIDEWGHLTTSSDPAANWRDPDLAFTPKKAIEAFTVTLKLGGAMTLGPAIGIFPVDRPADPTITGLGISHQDAGGPNPRFDSLVSKIRLTKAEQLYALLYKWDIIRVPGGGALFVLSSPDGNYGNNFLAWVEDADDLSDTYFGYDTNTSHTDLDEIRAIAGSKLAAPFLTRYGPCLSADTFNRVDSGSLGSTEVGAQAWAEIGNGAAISGNAVVCADQGGAVVNIGALPRIIDIDVLVPAGHGVNVRLYFRCGAAGNFADTLAYVCLDLGGYFYINGALTAASGAGALVAGQVNRMRIVDFGDHVRCFTNNNLAVDHATSVNYDATHRYGGFFAWTQPAGSNVDNWRAYPTTITPPALLGTLPATPAETGAAIFSDTFTDANGTALATHNAAWTVMNDATFTGTFEINDNKARITADGTPAAAWVETGVVNHMVTATVHTPNTEPADENDEWFSGLGARITDHQNRIEARLIYTSSREIELWEQYEGWGKLISMVKLSALLAKDTDYVVKLICVGEIVVVYLGSKLVNWGRTRLLTGTKVGITCTAKGGVGNRTTWDGFSTTEATA